MDEVNQEINQKIHYLNKKGFPVIFMITGNNSAGKTRLAKELIKNLDFYQTINLGLASKLVRYFRPDIDVSNLENLNGNEAAEIFKDLVGFIIDFYSKTGVNVIIEGVQIDTIKFSKDYPILGGVILEVSEKLAIQRGNHPETHFLRKLERKDLKRIAYEETTLFRKINNDGNFDDTYKVTLDHINKLLDNKILSMSERKEIIKFSQKLRKSKDLLKRAILHKKFRRQKDAIILLRHIDEFRENNEYLGDKWLYNGFVLRINNSLVIVDPGVSFYSRFLSSGLSLNQVNSIILTHKHLDHSNDLLVLLEIITKYRDTKLELYLPYDFYSEIPEYYKKLMRDKEVKVNLLKNDIHKFSFGFDKKIKIEFIKLHHSIKNTYGFKINIKNKRISYLSDTGYSVLVKTSKGEYKPDRVIGYVEMIIKKHDYIKKFYSDSNYLIANINDLHFNRHSTYHLSGYDLLDLLENSNVRILVLQHLPILDARGEDSKYIYKLFFLDQKYVVVIPTDQFKEIQI